VTDSNLPRWGLWYDFRNPAQWRRPFEDLYAEALDQIVWAEGLGYRSVWLTEHHFVDDGYTPSPLVIAAAIGARTEEMRIAMSLMLLPLHNPIRLAEDSATLSILTRGRFDLGVGIGYRPLEFEAFHRSLKNRPSLLEEGAEIIRRCWEGRSLEFSGKRFQLPDVTASPIPAVSPKLLIGGMNEPSIDRVARIADGFLSTQNDHQPLYLEALERHGKDPAEGKIHAGQWAIIDDDPERTWAEIGDHALYQLNEYISWGAFGPPDQVPRFPDPQAIVDGGGFQLWDGPTAVAELTALLRERPQIEDVFFWAQLPGESVESGSRRIDFFMREVAPRVESALRDGSALDQR
jgi:alkanesulfonate monooxygenase SsuD/methylene tetrahydromethanopterin reductase-like flavin-dependent oxidoreductase (luciferase family)